MSEASDPQALQKRVRELEEELSRARRQLGKLGVEEGEKSLHLIVSAEGLRAALPAALVQEIFRLVECTPFPDAPPHVLGTFICRGTPYTAVDLGARLGRQGPPSVSSHMLLLEGPERLCLVVDEVESLLEAPPLFSSDASGALPDAWKSSPLVDGVIRGKGGEGVVAVLSVRALFSGLPPNGAGPQG